jgi:hypothetical protein
MTLSNDFERAPSSFEHSTLFRHSPFVLRHFSQLFAQPVQAVNLAAEESRN